MDNNYIGLLVKDDGPDKTDKILYIYEAATIRYVGYINMTELLERPSNVLALDFMFPRNQSQGGLIVFCRDEAYLLA